MLNTWIALGGWWSRPSDGMRAGHPGRRVRVVGRKRQSREGLICSAPSDGN